jgi:hypothetical protein
MISHLASNRGAAGAKTGAASPAACTILLLPAVPGYGRLFMDTAAKI